MLKISNRITLPAEDFSWQAIRSQGPGGQNVNKVATAVQLFFNVHASLLPASYKERLLRRKDRRMTNDGVIIIKAQRFNSQERNREDALQRLKVIIQAVAVPAKKRTATKPTKASKVRRLEGKARRGRTKALRGKVSDES